MIQGLYVSLGGGIIESRNVEIISNNIANANTVGFKRDEAVLGVKPFIRELMGMTDPQANPLLATIGDGVQFSKTSTIHSQGPLRNTGNPFDLAIQGRGFFAVERNEAGKNNVYYTRAGNFDMDKEGYLVLKNDTRARLLGEDMNPIRVYVEETPGAHVQVRNNGTVALYAADEEIGAVGKIGVFDFSKTEGNILKVGENLYKALPDAERMGAEKSLIHQFTLEDSNVNGITEMAKMIESFRKYEANMRFVTLQDQTLQRATNDLGRTPA